jgi:hypothetical protein
MERETENPEDIDRLLTAARKALQEFEDGADWRRLLLRVRTASPVHPLLLLRLLFATAAVLALVGAIAVMLVPLFNSDLARTLAAFDAVVPYVPEELPALPSLLVALAGVMTLGWMFATYAAMSLGRDTTMLPWEQKQHQKLVNEVTRLTTQKAVMERIRATPAGARPRIATPVPVAARGRKPASAPATSALSRRATTPSGAQRTDDSPSYVVPAPEARPRGGPGPSTPLSAGSALGAGGFGARPGAPRLPAPPPLAEPEPEAPTPVVAPKPAGGLLARAKSLPSTGRPTAPPPPPEPEPEPEPDEEEIAADSVSLGYSPPVTATTSVRTAKALPPADDGGGVRLGGVRLGGGGRAPAPEPEPAPDDFSDLVEVAPEPPPAKEPPKPSAVTPLEAPRNDGILGRARAGTTNNRSTPFGAAGRIRPPPSATSSGKRAAPTTPPPEANEPSTRSGSPLGAAPRSGVSVRNTRAADTAAADPSVRTALPGGMFGTPPPISRQAAPPAPVTSRAAPPAPLGGKAPPPLKAPAPPKDPDVDEVTVMEEDADVATELHARITPDPARSRAPASAPPPLQRPFPRFGPIPDAWLSEAIEKAEKLQRGFPIQAHLEFSQEPHLPFTLVIARATPAMAVRAMVNFVEFLAQISTPPRARIELVNIPHLDRSFHKNVEAALEPYFQGNVEVEPNPGRVDILFTEPDPQWGEWSTLPVLDASP